MNIGKYIYWYIHQPTSTPSSPPRSALRAPPPTAELLKVRRRLEVVALSAERFHRHTEAHIGFRHAADLASQLIHVYIYICICIYVYTYITMSMVYVQN